MNAISRTLCTCLLLAACGGSKPAPAPATPQPEPVTAPAPDGAGKSMTADQCTAAGGQVVGDIGDGAIHKPDYRCPGSGEAPLGHIAPEAGKPVAIEGAVCCR